MSSNNPERHEPVAPTTGSRRRYAARIEVDREDQVSELLRLAARAGIGVTIAESDGARPLDFVTVVDVAERERGTYVFAAGEDARRFVDAVDSDPEADGDAARRRAFDEETLVSLGAAAEGLIAAERGDVLEEAFGPELAEDVRDGKPLPAALTALEELCEGDSRAAELLRHWIEIDRDGPPISPVADASTPTACTVVARKGRGGLPIVIPVVSSVGPEDALELAHRRWEDDRPGASEVELEMVAIFQGHPRLADFDEPRFQVGADLPGIDPVPLVGEEIMRQVVAAILDREEVGTATINAYLAAHGAAGLYESYVGPAITMCEEQIEEGGE